MSDQFQQQTPYTQIAQPKDSTLALISMILGIAAYVFLPGIGAIAAVILGHMAKNEIKNSNGMIKGSGMATAGLILGYVQIGLSVISLCALFVVLPALGASIGDVFSNINTSMY